MSNLEYDGPDTLSMQIRSLRDQQSTLEGLLGGYDGHQDANDRAADLIKEAAYMTRVAIFQAEIRYHFFGWEMDENTGDTLTPGEFQFRLSDDRCHLDIRCEDFDQERKVIDLLASNFLEGWGGDITDPDDRDELYSAFGWVNVNR